MRCFKNRGQAVIEFLLSVGILIIIYLSIYENLIPSIEQSTSSLIVARELIWERKRSVEKTRLTGNYRLNEHTQVFFDPINRVLPVNLEGDNLRLVKRFEGQPFYPMIRLTDSWQAKTNFELSSRPASLIVNNALSGDVTRIIQDGLGWIFLAEELNSDSLIFGTISPDIVPPEAYQRRE